MLLLCLWIISSKCLFFCCFVFDTALNHKKTTMLYLLLAVKNYFIYIKVTRHRISFFYATDILYLKVEFHNKSWNWSWIRLYLREVDKFNLSLFWVFSSFQGTNIIHWTLQSWLRWRIVRMILDCTAWCYQIPTLQLYRSPSNPSTTICFLLWSQLSLKTQIVIFDHKYCSSAFIFAPVKKRLC